MKLQEFYIILAAIIIFTVVSSFSFAIVGQWSIIPQILFFSVIIVLISVFAKKLMSHLLDADVEHDLWKVYRYGFRPGWHFEKPVPAGIIFPIFFNLFSLGLIKLGSIMTFETRAKKVRAAKRFGSYSFTEMTDWHNGIIGASGIVALLILAVISYFLPFNNTELLAKLSIFFAISNLIPFSNLDGSQIFYGSRLLWVVLSSITLIFFVFAVAI